MAAKVRGKPFAKGQSGNPNGSSARKRTLGRISRLTSAEVEQVGSLVLTSTVDQLHVIAQDPQASVLQTWIANLVVNSMTQGCPNTFRILMDRVCGKARETVELSGPAGGPLSMEVATREMTPDEMQKRADELARQRAEAGDD